MALSFVPDWVFKNVCEITPNWLKERGIKGIIADLDNTLAQYGHNEAKEDVSNWINSLQTENIPFAIASNNNEQRVKTFCAAKSIPYIAKVGKPKPFGLLKLAELFQIEPQYIAMVGDQIFTDVAAGKRAGMVTVIVDPLGREIWFLARRLVEKPFIYRSIAKRRRAK